MGEIQKDAALLSTITNLKELDVLLTILQSNNVRSFKLQGLEIHLDPQSPVVTQSSDGSNSQIGDFFNGDGSAIGNYGIWSQSELKNNGGSNQ